MTTVHIASKNTVAPATKATKAKKAAPVAELPIAPVAAPVAPPAPTPPAPAPAAPAAPVQAAPAPAKVKAGKATPGTYGKYVAQRCNIAARRNETIIKRLRLSSVEQAQEVADMIASANELLRKAAAVAYELPSELRVSTVGAAVAAWTPAKGDKCKLRAAANVRKTYEDLLTPAQMDALTVLAVRGNWVFVDVGDGSNLPSQIRRAHLIRG